MSDAGKLVEQYRNNHVEELSSADSPLSKNEERIARIAEYIKHGRRRNSSRGWLAAAKEEKRKLEDETGIDFEDLVEKADIDIELP